MKTNKIDASHIDRRDDRWRVQTYSSGAFYISCDDVRVMGLNADQSPAGSIEEAMTFADACYLALSPVWKAQIEKSVRCGMVVGGFGEVEP